MSMSCWRRYLHCFLLFNWKITTYQLPGLYKISFLINFQYRDIASRIQEVFNILIEAPQVPPVERRNIRHEPPAQFDNPIPGAPREVRRVGRPRLHPLPQPRAINHRAAVPRIAHRAGNGGRAARNARRGARNARRAIISLFSLYFASLTVSPQEPPVKLLLLLNAIIISRRMIMKLIRAS